MIVDFQIPGSPDKSTTHHGTIQPHSTLFNSLDLVFIFISLFSLITSSKFESVFASHFSQDTFHIFASLNSFRVFHSLQKLH
ncbi:MAG: hypothetical protein P1U46_04365 [Patescibacteria group bacterium]|nr:hypothetical protein [Patescibacteria group bacterium]